MWIRNAVRCHVEDLDLLIYLVDGFSLPFCVFLSQYLRSLSVNLARQILEVPSLPFSSNIYYLKLVNVNLDERFFPMDLMFLQMHQEVRSVFY